MSGVVLGAFAGIGFGLFQAVHRRVNVVLDVYRATFGLIAVGTVLLGGIAITTEDVGQVLRAPAGALAAFAGAGFLHFFGGWTFLGLSQQRIGAARTGALIGAMPLIGTVAAALVLGEMLSVPSLAAVAVVVVGVAAVTLSGRGRARKSRATATGVAFALATAVCWSTSPLLIRLGLRGLESPLLGVTIGMVATTVVYGVAVALFAQRPPAVPVRGVLGSVVLAGTFVGLSIWAYWAALDIAQVGVVLAVTQLSAPTVAIASPFVSGDPLGGGGRWLWIGIGLILTGSVALLLRST